MGLKDKMHKDEQPEERTEKKE